MARATVEEHPQKSGAALLVAVTLGIVFLLFVAFLNTVKPAPGAPPAPFFTESNLLYVALILYAGATALYIGFGVTGLDRYVKAASFLTMFGFVANTVAHCLQCLAGQIKQSNVVIPGCNEIIGQCRCSRANINDRCAAVYSASPDERER